VAVKTEQPSGPREHDVLAPTVSEAHPGLPAGALALQAQQRDIPAGTSSPVRFVLELGRALHRFGAHADHLEQALVRVSATLGLEGQFFSTPTSLFSAFGSLEEQRTYLIRIEPGEVNASKLTDLDALVDEVLSTDMSIDDATKAVQKIIDAPPLYGWVGSLCAASIVGGTAATLFGGHWQEVITAAVIGLVVGILVRTITRYRSSARLLEVVAGGLAAVIAVTASWLLGPISVYTAIAAGIVLLLPGLTFTIAVNEVATRNLVAGSARLVGAITVICTLGFGVASGFLLERAIGTAAEPALAVDPAWWIELAALIGAASAMVVLFVARTTDWPLFVISAAIGFYGGRFGAALMGPETGACIGAFWVTVASNLMSRTLKRPATPLALPGILLLVPGTVGYRSFTALLEEDVLSGVDGAFTMLLVALSIVVGMLVANVALPSRRVI